LARAARLPRAHLTARRRRARLALAAAWPLLVAAAPAPPGGFARGFSASAGALQAGLDDARAVGFDTVRVFLRWDKIETREGEPDWTCRFVAEEDLRPEAVEGGVRTPWPDVPCDGTPCGCGYSADERVALAARDGAGPAVMLTLFGTPAWARGAPAPGCPAGAPPYALPLRRGKEAAFRNFVAAAAARYGAMAYAFELWDEPDLAECGAWAGTREEYREEILPAARAVKESGAQPGIVVAPTLEHPSGDAMNAWVDWSEPIDVLSFNVYTLDLGGALARLDEMGGWCRTTRRCPGFYVTEFGARRAAPRHCPGPESPAPGATDVAIMRRCRRSPRCAGFFLYSLSDRSQRPECDRGLFAARGCRKRRLCTIARRFFATVPPFACRGCGA